MEARRREPERYVPEHQVNDEPLGGTVESMRVEEERPHADSYAFPDPRRDLIHWGPVWAGVLAGFITMILLALLGLAAGIADFASQAQPGEIATPAVIWSAVTLLVSYFVGGWIAGRTATYRDVIPAAFFHGSMVFALSLVLLLLMAGIGAAGIFASALSVFGPITGGVAPNVPPEQVLSAAQTSALWSLVTLLLAYGAAVLGAYVGVRSSPAHQR